MKFGYSNWKGSPDIGQRSRWRLQFRPLLNVHYVRPEVLNDVIPGAVIEPTGVKAPVKVVDSRSNRSRDI